MVGYKLKITIKPRCRIPLYYESICAGRFLHLM